MSSPQGSYVSPQMPMNYTYPAYTARPYPTPTLYIPKPLGIPMNSMPSSQGSVLSEPQLVPTKS